jgi:tetratricopeptide (TPR) repeat protein
VAIGAWGISRAISSKPQPNDILPQIDALNQIPKTPANSSTPSKDETNDVTALAIKNFAQGNLRIGQQEVTALLDRGALNAADTALAAVPRSQVGNPSINFLRGRLAWQSAKTGNSNFRVEDARRAWDTAAKGKPDPVYFNALGFAYYAEGNLQRATDAWFESLRLLEQQATGQTKPSQDVLTAYAGLALASQKSAATQPADRQAKLRGEAVRLRDRVLQSAPEKFQPGALAQNWLWTEAAIADWSALQAVK